MTHNPYAPPLAPVDDVTQPAEVRPVPVTWAVRCCWAFLLLGLPGAFRAILGVPANLRYRTAFVIIMFGILAALIVAAAWLFHSIGRGRRWARIAMFVLAALAVYSTAKDVSEDFAAGWYFGVIYLLSTGFEVAAVLLLFLPPASQAWFARRPISGA